MLFTKAIDKKLFAQYPLGNMLEKQQAVCKIFNPYGRGTWYVINSDPQDPDYLWCIVDMYEVEVGSVLRSELETLRLTQFRLPLERDLSFEPVNAAMLLKQLQQGQKFAKGGELKAGIKVEREHLDTIRDVYNHRITTEQAAEHIAKDHLNEDSQYYTKLATIEKKFAEGGQVNGKKSNLTPEQARLVRTPEFKAWFGDWENDPENASKVVDENGKPMVVYHGSPDLRGLKEQGVFKTNRQMYSGIDDEASYYFTDSYSKAKSYADPKRAFDYQNAEEGVISVYLSLQNPLEVNAGGRIWRRFETEMDGQKITGTRELVKYAKTKNYDGLIVKNVRDYYNNNENKSKAGNVYVAFYQTQIKLAGGSNTTFDPNNPDIRFAKGGEVKTDFSNYQNPELRQAMLSLWQDFMNGGISNYLGINKESYVLTDQDNLMIIVRPKDDFTAIEKEKIGRWIEPYLNMNKKPEIAKYLEGYSVEANKIMIRLKGVNVYSKGGPTAPEDKLLDAAVKHAVIMESEKEKYRDVAKTVNTEGLDEIQSVLLFAKKAGFNVKLRNGIIISYREVTDTDDAHLLKSYTESYFRHKYPRLKLDHSATVIERNDAGYVQSIRVMFTNGDQKVMYRKDFDKLF